MNEHCAHDDERYFLNLKQKMEIYEYLKVRLVERNEPGFWRYKNDEESDTTVAQLFSEKFDTVVNAHVIARIRMAGFGRLKPSTRIAKELTWSEKSILEQRIEVIEKKIEKMLDFLRNK